MLSAKSSKNFLRPDQNWSNFGSFKGVRVVNPRRLSHFASKSVERCDLQVGWGKKLKSHRPDQNWAHFGRFKGLMVRGFKKLQFLPQKAHVYVNPRRLSHFASKSVEGCDLQDGLGKKVRKSQSLP